MIEAINPDEPIRYTLPEDKENPTTWLLKRLSVAEEKKLSISVLSAMDGNTISDQEALMDANETTLHIGLLGAENYDGKFERDESKPAVFKDIKPWTENTLVQIKRKYRDQLAAAVMMGGEVAEPKNS